MCIKALPSVLPSILISRGEYGFKLQSISDFELQIGAIQKELKKNRPDTKYLHSKVRNIEEWLGEIDLAEKRAMERKRMRKMM